MPKNQLIIACAQFKTKIYQYFYYTLLNQGPITYKQKTFTVDIDINMYYTKKSIKI